VIEEYLAEELRFVVVAHDEESLRALHRMVRGRIARIAKKGLVQIEYTAQPCLTQFQRREADGQEVAMVVVPLSEVGAFPLGVIPYRASIYSAGTEGGIHWHIQDVIWSYSDVRFRPGVLIYADAQGRGISISLVKAMKRASAK